MNEFDPASCSFTRRVNLDLLSVESNASGIAPGDTPENLHQGRLAGAILADQRENLARMNVEVHLFQGQHAGKALADAGHFQYGLRHF